MTMTTTKTIPGAKDDHARQDDHDRTMTGRAPPPLPPLAQWPPTMPASHCLWGGNGEQLGVDEGTTTGWGDDDDEEHDNGTRTRRPGGGGG